MSGGKGMAARPPSSGRKQVTIRVYTGSPASPASSPQDLRPGQDETTGFLEVSLLWNTDCVALCCRVRVESSLLQITKTLAAVYATFLYAM